MKEKEEQLKKDDKEEDITPEGSYDENDVSVYYDFTDEDTNEYPTFFKYIGNLCKQKVFYFIKYYNKRCL